jgi:hypothetical protein
MRSNMQFLSVSCHQSLIVTGCLHYVIKRIIDLIDLDPMSAPMPMPTTRYESASECSLDPHPRVPCISPPGPSTAIPKGCIRL